MNELGRTSMIIFLFLDLRFPKILIPIVIISQSSPYLYSPFLSYPSSLWYDESAPFIVFIAVHNIMKLTGR